MKAFSFLRPSSSSSGLPAGAAILLACIVAILQSHSRVQLLVTAEKDSDYYQPGDANPNVKIKMYWKDSVNVLQDLDQFEALYIKYHGCVWTKYGSRYGLGDEEDDQDDEDEVDDNGCGGWGGEFFWYMGQTQCFKANVAYSLYGILAGESAGSNPCTKSTYINSFFTTFGAESFAGPLGLGVDDASSQCRSVSPDGAERGDGNEDFYQYVAADDDYLDDNYQFFDYASYTSYGAGCSAEGKFVTDKYSGAFCHGRNYMETLDTLDSFNQAVESMQCTQIYSASNGDTYNEPENKGDGYNFEEMSAVTLLSFSKACSLRQYPNDCPDPYNIKKKYAQNVERAFAYTTGSQRDVTTKLLNISSYIFLALGLICWFLSYRVLKSTRGARRDARKLERSRSKERRSRSKSKGRSSSKGTVASRGNSPDSARSSASIERAASAVSEFSHKSWTSLGNAAAAGAAAATSVCANDSSSPAASKSPSRMKKLFSSKKNGGST